MDIIDESAEHHFLTTLDKIKKDPSKWYGLRLCFSRKLDHADMIKTPAHIRGKIHTLTKQVDEWFNGVKDRVEKLGKPIVYRFSDFDILILLRAPDDAARDAMKSLCLTLGKEFGEKNCEFTSLAKDIYKYQKLSDRKFISAKLMESYKMMADSNKVASIALRRGRHEDPVVMMVEDDRFTATYAANILNKDFDLILAKSGEEAIALYIEYCPDIVFLDIHLPGLSGLDTLVAIKKVDPQAFAYMLSVDTVKTNIVTATENGAQGFLKKPFTKDRILAVADKSPFVREAKSRMKSPLLR